MSARRMIQSAKKMATGAYLKPWRDGPRARLLMIGFVANMTYGLMSFALNYAMAGEGFEQSIAYQLLRMPLMGFGIVPLTFWLMAYCRSRLPLALLQLLGIALFLVDPASGVWNAFAFALVGTSYWVLYNHNFVLCQSRDNQGNETALSMYLVILSYSCGLFLGGVLLEQGLLKEALLGSGIVLMLATCVLYQPIPKGSHLKETMRLVGWKKPATRLTYLASMQNIIIEGCMPIWMRILGISPMAAGLNMALRPLLGTLLTPVAGYLIQKGGMKAPQFGGIAVIFGWILLAGTHNYPWLLVPAMTLLALGTGFIAPSEVARWYKRRSVAGILAREGVLAFGRTSSFALAIPTIFFFPLVYPLVGLGVSVLFMVGTRSGRKGFGGTQAVKGEFIKDPV